MLSCIPTTLLAVQTLGKIFTLRNLYSAIASVTLINAFATCPISFYCLYIETLEGQTLLLSDISHRKEEKGSNNMKPWLPHGWFDSLSVILSFVSDPDCVHVCVWFSFSNMSSIACVPFIGDSNLLCAKQSGISLAPSRLIRYPFGDVEDLSFRVNNTYQRLQKQSFDIGSLNDSKICLSLCSEPNLGHQYWNHFCGFIDILDYLKEYQSILPINTGKSLMYMTMEDTEYFPMHCFASEGFDLVRYQCSSGEPLPKYILSVDSIRPRYDNMRKRLLDSSIKPQTLPSSQCAPEPPYAIMLVKGNSPFNGQNTISASILLQVIPEIARYLVCNLGINLVFDGCCSPHEVGPPSLSPKRDSFIAREQILYDLSSRGCEFDGKTSRSVIGLPILEKVRIYEGSQFVISFANSAVFLPFAMQKLVIDFKPPHEFSGMLSSSSNRSVDFNYELWCLVLTDFTLPAPQIISHICAHLDQLVSSRRKFISLYNIISSGYSPA